MSISFELLNDILKGDQCSDDFAYSEMVRFAQSLKLLSQKT